jgi:hypothetical protein
MVNRGTDYTILFGSVDLYLGNGANYNPDGLSRPLQARGLKHYIVHDCNFKCVKFSF